MKAVTQLGINGNYSIEPIVFELQYFLVVLILCLIVNLKLDFFDNFRMRVMIQPGGPCCHKQFFWLSPGDICQWQKWVNWNIGSKRHLLSLNEAIRVSLSCVIKQRGTAYSPIFGKSFPFITGLMDIDTFVGNIDPIAYCPSVRL